MIQELIAAKLLKKDYEAAAEARRQQELLDKEEEKRKKELLRQERTPAWLARKINCQRPNIYYIFSQPSINTELLERISRALGVDFFMVLSECIKKEM